MNKKIGLLAGGLGLLLVSTAGATSTPTLLCGGVGSGTGSGTILFSTSNNGPGGSASTPNPPPSTVGNGVIVCNGFAADGFTLPAADTLTGIVVTVGDDAEDALNANSQITWTWTYSGDVLSPVPGGTDANSPTGGSGPIFAFNACPTGGSTGNLVCNVPYGFNFTSPYDGTDSFTFNVLPTVTGGGGAGVSSEGSDSAEVYISFTYVPTASIPEPTSLVLIGSGLIGLGVVARRKRRS
jgi:hypothetical protein